MTVTMRQSSLWIDVIIAVSEADRNRLCMLYPDSRGVVLPNGVDLDTWQPLPAHEGNPTLLFPAALNWEPNIEATRILYSEAQTLRMAASTSGMVAMPAGLEVS